MFLFIVPVDMILISGRGLSYLLIVMLCVINMSLFLSFFLLLVLGQANACCCPIGKAVSNSLWSP